MTSDQTSRRRLRRNLLTAVGGLLLSGCDALSRSHWFPKVLKVGEDLSRSVQHALTPRKSMAQEFTEADLSPTFRSNGTANPDDAAYQALARRRLRRLATAGRRAGRAADELLARSSCAPCAAGCRSRVTIASRAGAPSASGKACRWPTCWRWCGRPRRRATWCSIAPIRWTMPAPNTTKASTWRMPIIRRPFLPMSSTTRPLPIANGAPLRVRVERQLGYKMAKYIMRIELVGQLRAHRRRQRRLLGGSGLRMVRGHLSECPLPLPADSLVAIARTASAYSPPVGSRYRPQRDRNHQVKRRVFAKEKQ